LSLSAKLAEIFDGRIDVQSEEQKGTTVKIYLTLKLGEAKRLSE